jgi:methionyl-tRNA formyltransferase
LSLHGSAEEIYLRASEVIEQMIFEIVRTNPEPVEQAGEPIFFKRRSPDQGNLLNAQSLEQAFDLIRMLDAAGYPRAFVNVGKFCMKFSRVTQKSDGLIADVSITLQDQDTERTE